MTQGDPALTAASVQGAQGAYVAANGLRMYYEVSGAGDPLILLHAGAETSASWAEDVLIFAQQFRVYALDSRGHGRTANPARELSYRTMAEDVAAFCAALGIAHPFICGHSDGGNIALELGMRHPEVPRALVMSGVVHSGSDHYTAALQAYLGVDQIAGPQDLLKIEQKLPGLVARLQTLHDAFQHPDYWKTLLTEAWQMWNAPLGYTPGDFQAITAPALVLLGDRDEFLPIEEAVALYRALPHAELGIVPNSGHGFMPYMRSIAFDFLRRVREGGA
jgi:pimeloyl-ACP methyl ester carboxylesterase